MQEIKHSQTNEAKVRSDSVKEDENSAISDQCNNHSLVVFIIQCLLITVLTHFSIKHAILPTEDTAHKANTTNKQCCVISSLNGKACAHALNLI